MDLLHTVRQNNFSVVQVTSDVGEAEALGSSGAVGLRVEIEPNTAPGGDEGWRQRGATQPRFAAPRRCQQEPVAQTVSRLRQVKVTETGADN